MRSGKANKGSQRLLQEYVTNKMERLNNYLLGSSPTLLAYLSNKEIEWISPIASNNYYEYRDDFLKPFYNDSNKLVEATKQIREFWPKNGPQWDGLAVIKEENVPKGLILIEAKANI